MKMKHVLAIPSIALIVLIGSSCATQKAARVKPIYTAIHKSMAVPDTVIWDNGDTTVYPDHNVTWR